MQYLHIGSLPPQKKIYIYDDLRSFFSLWLFRHIEQLVKFHEDKSLFTMKYT